MRKLAVWIAIMVGVVGSALAQDYGAGDPGLGDPYFPSLGNGGYDVQHYTLDLTVPDIEANVIEGVVTIEAEATEPLNAFNLDFLGFHIDELLVNGETAITMRDGRELSIIPPQPIDEGETFTVEVIYSGIPGEGVRRDSGPLYAAGWVNFDDGVFVASEPAGAARWFPSNDHPLDKATYTFRITVPEPYVVAANGLLQETIEEDGMITYVWESQHPMATYLATVNIGEFAVEEEEGPDGLPVRNYFPERLFERGTEQFENQPAMIELFNEIFGPYPFEAYGAVVVDVNLGFALETQTMSLFGVDILSPLSFQTAAEDVIAHELAHQWFGDSVSPATWQDIWLNEGFASYASALWVEHAYGEDAFASYMNALYEIISDPDFSAKSGFLIGKPPADDLFNGAIYLRGAWTLHALRLTVGDDDFFEILQTYYDRYKYGNASIPDFIEVAEEVSGEDLTDFFDGWLYEAEVPVIPEGA